MPRVHIFKVSIEAAAQPAHGAGAIGSGRHPQVADCWVLAEDERSAASAVTTAILDAMRIPGTVHGIERVDPSALREGDPARERVVEAIECGCSIVLRDEDQTHAG